MDHNEATRIQAPSRYVLGELSSSEQEEFEQHYFTCPECADELRLETIFAENARAIFEEPEPIAAHPTPERKPTPAVADRGRQSWAHVFGWFTPVAAVLASILLGIVLYDRMYLIPRLNQEVASVVEPQPISTFPLKISREDHAITVPKSQPYFALYFDRAKPVRYRCVIQDRSGRRKEALTLLPPPIGQPYSILLKRSEFPTGTYLFKLFVPESNQLADTYQADLITD